MAFSAASISSSASSGSLIRPRPKALFSPVFGRAAFAGCDAFYAASPNTCRLAFSGNRPPSESEPATASEARQARNIDAAYATLKRGFAKTQNNPGAERRLRNAAVREFIGVIETLEGERFTLATSPTLASAYVGLGRSQLDKGQAIRAFTRVVDASQDPKAKIQALLGLVKIHMKPQHTRYYSPDKAYAFLGQAEELSYTLGSRVLSNKIWEYEMELKSLRA